MAQASRDQNNVPTLLAVSSADGVTPVPVYANPTTHALLTESSGGSGIPQGAIILWSGLDTNIPSGYALCDGTNGTPNLADNFVMGAGNVYGPGNTGGLATAIFQLIEDPGTGQITQTGGEYYKPLSDATSVLNPFYALCYIMKL